MDDGSIAADLCVVDDGVTAVFDADIEEAINSQRGVDRGFKVRLVVT